MAVKKFKFQLETLLKVTKMKRDEAEVAFAEATRQLENAQAQLRQYLQDMRQGQLDYERLTTKGTISLGKLMAYNSFFDWKRAQIENQQQIILKCRQERQRKLATLLEVIHRLKSIEQLKERRRREYLQEMLHEEQKQLDEIGLQLYVRANER